MSHIIKSEQDITAISQLLEKIRIKGYTTDILEEILYTITPQNKNLPINININTSQKPALFNEEMQKIEINPEILKTYINKQINLLTKIYPALEKEIFYYHILLALTHECEHYYQSLIENKYIDFPYTIVIDGYHNLKFLKLPKDLNHIDTLIKINRFYKYSHNPDSILERNANVESYDLLVKVATYENNTELLKILNNLLSYQLSLGYKGKSNGSMEKTYKKKGIISIFNSLDQTEIIPIKDKIRYGLPIDKETRKKVLKKQFKI